MTAFAWQDRYALRVDLAHLRGQVSGDWDEPATVTEARGLVVDLPYERRDAYSVIVSRPALVRVLQDAVEHVERAAWPEADALAQLLDKGGDPSAAVKLRACHNPEQGWWKFYPDNDKPPKYYADRCWLRVCPHCATAFANKLRARYEGRIETVIAQDVYSWSLKKIELTMRRSDDLARDLSDLHKMTKKLYKHFFGRDKRAGAFGCAEVGPRGGNVHVHLVAYGPFVAQAAISAYWEKLSRRHREVYEDAAAGDGDRIVWVKRIQPGAAVREAIKYITKFAKHDDGEPGNAFVLPVEDLAALHFALKGKRRVWSWGAFYGLDEPEGDGLQELTDDLSEEAVTLNALPVVVSHPELKAIISFLHLTVENNYPVFAKPLNAPGALPAPP